MLVPEGRMEVTTEGGLDVAGQLARMKDVVAKLSEAGRIRWPSQVTEALLSTSLATTFPLSASTG